MALRVLCATLARRASSAAQQQQLLAPALLAAVQGGLNTSGAAALSTATAALPLARVAAAHQQLPPSFAATGSSAAFASRADGSDDDDENEPLESVLRRELKHEQATYEQPEAVAQGPPAPFTLTSAPGDGTLTLTRDFNGEKVTVEASLNMQEGGAEFMDDDEDEGGEGDEDEDDEPAFSSSVSFVVTVERNGEALVFDCASDGAYLEIEHVALEPAGGAASETAYSGPVFDELADGVRGAFERFLAARGVDEDLGEWLRFALYDKEQREYVRWLERAAAFAAGSK